MVHQFPRFFRRERLGTHAAVATGLMGVLGFVGVLLVLLIYPYMKSELRVIAQVVMFAALFPYFLAGGTTISLVLRHAEAGFFRVYAVDLTAAALGAVASVAFLEGTSPTAVFLGPLCLIPLVGAACFNYTRPETVQAHTEWAAQNEVPAPDDTVLWAGAGAATLGGLVLGLGLRKPKGGKA